MTTRSEPHLSAPQPSTVKPRPRPRSAGRPTPRPTLLTLLDQFVACRTTLDDLQQRIAALGEQLRITDIAHHLTGKAQLPSALHNVLAAAINQRLTELAEPATATYRRQPALQQVAAPVNHEGDR